MKDIYLVRHGQTKANLTRRHQSSDEVLSTKGKKQAHNVALFLREKNIDELMCSTYARARETAGVISEVLGLPYTTQSSFVEFKRPDTLYGKGYYSGATFYYLWRLFLHRENEDWDDCGAENMFAIRNRVQDAKTVIANAQGERIAVVTHDIFMNLFVELVCREKKYGFRHFARGMLLTRKTPNTGIIHLRYDENAPSGMCKWEFIELIMPKLLHEET